MENHQICIGCGLASTRVEAGGIWYCPNPACTACGAQPHKRKLKSYKEEERVYTVDPLDVIRYANEHDDELPDDVSICAEKCVSLFWGKQSGQ